MFKTHIKRSGKLTRLKLINAKTNEYVAVVPEFGANINELVLHKNGTNYSIIDGNKSPRDFVSDTWFKSAKLIPFPNRINNGEYLFQEKKYQLPINFSAQHHSIHGLIYNKKFNLRKINNTNKSAYMDLEHTYNKGLPGYPFHFKVTVRYSLTTKGLRCHTTIKNLSDREMPVGDGWHPYFQTEGTVDDLLLKLPSVKLIKTNKKMIPTGNKINYKKFSALSKIGRHKFDTGFLLMQKGPIVSTELYDKKKDIKIIIWQETGKMKYNYLQLFIPPARNSIAVEPMTCNSNAFNNKEGLILLKPEKLFKGNYGVLVE